MNALLLLTGSPSVTASLLHGSPMGYLSDQDSSAVISLPVKNFSPSPRSVLHLEMKAKKQTPMRFRRSLSDSDLIRSKITSYTQFRCSNRISIRSNSARISEEEDLPEQRIDLSREVESDAGCLILKRNGFDLGISDRATQILAGNDVLVEELEFSGGGMGKGKKVGGGNGGGRGGDGSGSFTGGNADQNKIGAYYKQMLQANPGNPLLLTNYGKFLHEVEKDYVKAEEYYGRAILASPGDGEVLSLYGKLIWETQKDQGRAKGYFNQAIQACPDDCYVLGSYAHFLWDANDEEEEEDGTLMETTKTRPLVEAH